MLIFFFCLTNFTNFAFHCFWMSLEGLLNQCWGTMLFGKEFQDLADWCLYTILKRSPHLSLTLVLTIGWCASSLPKPPLCGSYSCSSCYDLDCLARKLYNYTQKSVENGKKFGVLSKKQKKNIFLTRNMARLRGLSKFLDMLRQWLLYLIGGDIDFS